MTSSEDPILAADRLNETISALAREVSKYRGESERTKKWFRWLVGISIIAALGTGVGGAAAGLAYENGNKARSASNTAQAAADHAQAIAACINTNLFERSAPTAADVQSHIAFAVTILTVLTYPPSVDPAVNKTRLDKLIKDVRQYVTDLTAHQQTRTDHPIGKC